MMTSASTRRHVLTNPLLLAVALALATLAVYYPVRHLPFINYDDDLYVTENPHVQSGLQWDTLQWAFTTYDAANWHPLTWLSHALDFQLFGLTPAGPHIVNLLLHTLNVVLLFWVLWRATGFTGRSAMVAALFALHPINVQSVAWVAERKNLLSMTFFLLALGAYRWYAESVVPSAESAVASETSSDPYAARALPKVGVPRLAAQSRGGSLGMTTHIGRYLVVMLLFVIGLMAKPQIITLSLVLLLWDYWPLQRMTAGSVSRLLWEKLPLFALAAASAWITLVAHSAGQAVRYLPLSLRIANAILSYARYIKRALWPRHLALFYPHPQVGLTTWQVLACAAVLLGVTAVAVRYSLFALRQKSEIENTERRMANSEWRRAAFVGWLWFLVTLLPMIGIIQVGAQAMADRYAYLPFIGLFIMFVWTICDWAGRRHIPAKAQAAAGIAVLLALSLVTRRQLEHWQDSVTLWTHTLAITLDNSLAEVDLGAALVHRGEVARAMGHFRAAAAIDPNDPLANMYIARYAQSQNNLPEAIAAYRKVISATPDPNLKARAYSNLGYAYRALGDEAEAQKCFRAAAGLGY
jgi:protein O-mannosyl-transferase